MAKVFGKKNSKLATDNYILLMQGCNQSLLLRSIIGAQKAGGSISFSRTKDGKSVCVAFYDGSEQEKDYAADVTELEELLTSIIEYCEDDATDVQSPPPPPTTSKRGSTRK